PTSSSSTPPRPPPFARRRRCSSRPTLCPRAAELIPAAFTAGIKPAARQRKRMARQTFRDLIADNKRKSALLLVAFFLFTVFVALVLSLAIVFLLAPDAADEV